MAGIKGLVGRRQHKTYKFMGEDIKIHKLSVAEVIEIQEKAQANEGDLAGLNLLKHVARLSVEDAADLSNEDFDTFPMDELTKLTNEIMKFSGMSAETGK